MDVSCCRPELLAVRQPPFFQCSPIFFYNRKPSYSSVSRPLKLSRTKIESRDNRQFLQDAGFVSKVSLALAESVTCIVLVCKNLTTSDTIIAYTNVNLMVGSRTDTEPYTRENSKRI